MSLFRRPLLLLSRIDIFSDLLGADLAEICELAGCQQGLCQILPPVPAAEVQTWLQQCCPAVTWRIEPQTDNPTPIHERHDLVIPLGTEIPAEPLCAVWHLPLHSTSGPVTILAVDHSQADVIPMGVQLARAAQGRLLIASLPESPNEGQTAWERVQPKLSHLDWRTIPGGVRAIGITSGDDVIQLAGAEHVRHTVLPGSLLTSRLLSGLTGGGSSVLRLP